MSPEQLEELKEALALAKQTLRSTIEDLHFMDLAAKWLLELGDKAIKFEESWDFSKLPTKQRIMLRTACGCERLLPKKYGMDESPPHDQPEICVPAFKGVSAVAINRELKADEHQEHFRRFSPRGTERIGDTLLWIYQEM